jgi:hypothetical protein
MVEMTHADDGSIDIDWDRPLTRMKTPLHESEKQEIISAARGVDLDDERVQDHTGDLIQLSDTLFSTVLFRGEIKYSAQSPAHTGEKSVYLEYPITFEEHGDGFIQVSIATSPKNEILSITVDATLAV